MEVRSFTVYGEVRGKGRPRFFIRKVKQSQKCPTGQISGTYTDDKTRIYESLIQEAYLRDCGNVEPFGEVPLRLTVEAFIAIPQSFSKKKRAECLANAIRPTKAPDCDNILKSFDAINKVAWLDDKWIVEMGIKKWYVEAGGERLEVTIETIEGI